MLLRAQFSGGTRLHLAARHGSEDIVRVLLAAGADVDQGRVVCAGGLDAGKGVKYFRLIGEGEVDERGYLCF